MRDPAVEDWIERARRADIWTVLNQVAPHHAVKVRGRKGHGPCPACGGRDRFSIDRTKNLFYCRAAAKGGDAIALVEYLTGANFLGACEIVTGEAMPPRAASQAEVRGADAALMAEREALRLKQQAEAAASQIDYRQKEIDRAARIWNGGIALHGSAAAAYLARRRCLVPPGARLRAHPALDYWVQSETQKGWVVIHKGPALLARIDDAQNHFMGCHITWIDLATRKGKAEIVHPETGELCDAKKVRGAQKGGHIHLGGDPVASHHLIMGEGIETTLSVAQTLVDDGRDLAGHLLWAGINLGNIGGPHASMVTHPTLTRTDAKGHTRRLKVPGPEPAAEPKLEGGDRALMFPKGITTATLLGDGDSDRFTTENHLKRCAQRNARAGLVTRAAWPGEGVDFNDLAMMQEGGV